jgi:multisubunit Na+/H+ antiporter MnhB subunit
MTPADWLVDGVLALALPFLAWLVLSGNDLRRAVVLFIALGLLAALAWARLAAPDIALVEAAVGTGLTGALLMSSVSWAGPEQPPRPLGRISAVLAAGALIGLVMLLGWAVLSVPAPAAGLSQEVAREIELSGAAHPVTAVLLNFRGYDTLLEVMVLLVAAVGARRCYAGARQSATSQGGPLLGALVRLLLPGMVLVAGYLVWKGAHAPGGAFQAAAVLAGGGVLLLLTGRIHPPRLSSPGLRIVLCGGPVAFVLLAAAPLGRGRLLEYPQAWASTLIVLLECALALSIALMLVMLFPPASEPEPGGSAPDERDPP